MKPLMMASKTCGTKFLIVTRNSIGHCDRLWFAVRSSERTYDHQTTNWQFRYHRDSQIKGKVPLPYYGAHFVIRQNIVKI